MPSFLRSIAVTVDEPNPGSFYWVLLESDGLGDPFSVLSNARTGLDSYDAALAEGTQQLRRMCRDRRLGPTRQHAHAEANPSGWIPLV